MRTGGSSPGTAAEARTASAIGPSLNQVAAARSTLAATHWNGTARSSMHRTGRCCSMSCRSGAAECRCVPCFASRAAWLTSELEKTPASDSVDQRSASRSTDAAPGSAAMSAPFNAPTLVPSTRSGRTRRSTSAPSIPTWLAPNTPPPPRTKATLPTLTRPTLAT